jgi:hypothetical protein
MNVKIMFKKPTEKNISDFLLKLFLEYSALGDNFGLGFLYFLENSYYPKFAIVSEPDIGRGGNHSIDRCHKEILHIVLTLLSLLNLLHPHPNTLPYILRLADLRSQLA